MIDIYLYILCNYLFKQYSNTHIYICVLLRQRSSHAYQLARPLKLRSNIYTFTNTFKNTFTYTFLNPFRKVFAWCCA